MRRMLAAGDPETRGARRQKTRVRSWRRCIVVGMGSCSASVMSRGASCALSNIMSLYTYEPGEKADVDFCAVSIVVG